MTAVWPVALIPLTDSFADQRQPNRIAFEPEVGDDITRRRSTTSRKNITFKLLSLPGDTTLDDFHDTTLLDGSLPFTWTDPRTGASGTFKFRSPPKWASAGYFYEATCEIRRTT